MSVADLDRELGYTMWRARVDTDSDSIDCSVDVVGEGAPLVAIGKILYFFVVFPKHIKFIRTGANIFLVSKRKLE